MAVVLKVAITETSVAMYSKGILITYSMSCEQVVADETFFLWQFIKVANTVFKK